MPKALLVEPRSGDLLLATGVSRWGTGLQTISAVGATNCDCRRYAADHNLLNPSGLRRWLVECLRSAVRYRCASRDVLDSRGL
jgi:hypothetical protein